MTISDAKQLVQRARAVIARFEALPPNGKGQVWHLREPIQKLALAADALELNTEAIPEDSEHWQSPTYDHLARGVGLVEASIAEAEAAVHRRNKRHRLN